MTNKNKTLSLATVLAAALAFPALAAADHAPTTRPTTQAVLIGTVGTHTHDAEDYVPVSAAQQFQRLELRASGNPVALDQVKIQYADGQLRTAGVRGTLRPGERVVIDVPAYPLPVKMLVLDYGNTGPYWRARETAHLEVYGLITVAAAPRHRHGNTVDRRTDDRHDRRDLHDRHDRFECGNDARTPRAPRAVRYQEPEPAYPAPTPVSTGARFEWRGGVYVRIN